MYKRFFFLSMLFTLVSLILAFSVWSKNQPFIEEKELNRFLNDLPDIPGLTVQTSQNMKACQQGETIDTEQMKMNMGASQDAIEKKGWDPNRFYHIYGHVMMVTSLENINRLTKNVAPQMAQAMKSIKDNPYMSEEQKQQMMKQMGQGMAAGNKDLTSLRAQVKQEVPPSERRLIKSKYSKICNIMGLPENIGADMQQTY